MSCTKIYKKNIIKTLFQKFEIHKYYIRNQQKTTFFANKRNFIFNKTKPCK